MASTKVTSSVYENNSKGVISSVEVDQNQRVRIPVVPLEVYITEEATEDEIKAEIIENCDTKELVVDYENADIYIKKDDQVNSVTSRIASKVISDYSEGFIVNINGDNVYLQDVLTDLENNRVTAVKSVLGYDVTNNISDSSGNSLSISEDNLSIEILYNKEDENNIYTLQLKDFNEAETGYIPYKNAYGSLSWKKDDNSYLSDIEDADDNTVPVKTTDSSGNTGITWAKVVSNTDDSAVSFLDISELNETIDTSVQESIVTNKVVYSEYISGKIIGVGVSQLDLSYFEELLDEVAAEFNVYKLEMNNKMFVANSNIAFLKGGYENMLFETFQDSSLDDSIIDTDASSVTLNTDDTTIESSSSTVFTTDLTDEIQAKLDDSDTKRIAFYVIYESDSTLTVSLVINGTSVTLTDNAIIYDFEDITISSLYFTFKASSSSFSIDNIAIGYSII